MLNVTIPLGQYTWIGRTAPKPILFLPYDCGFGDTCSYQEHRTPLDYNGSLGWYCFDKKSTRSLWTFSAYIRYWSDIVLVSFSDDDDYWLTFSKEGVSLQYAKNIAEWLNSLAYFDIEIFNQKFKGWSHEFD